MRFGRWAFNPTEAFGSTDPIRSTAVCGSARSALPPKDAQEVLGEEYAGKAGRKREDAIMSTLIDYAESVDPPSPPTRTARQPAASSVGKVDRITELPSEDDPFEMGHLSK